MAGVECLKLKREFFYFMNLHAKTPRLKRHRLSFFAIFAPHIHHRLGNTAYGVADITPFAAESRSHSFVMPPVGAASSRDKNRF
jgi:hypothetical protein